MREYLNRLVALSTYARMKEIAPKTAYEWCKTKKAKLIEIDTKKFIELNDKDYEQFKMWRK